MGSQAEGEAEGEKEKKSSRNSKQLPATLSNPTNLGLSLLRKEGRRSLRSRRNSKSRSRRRAWLAQRRWTSGSEISSSLLPLVVVLVLQNSNQPSHRSLGFPCRWSRSL